VNLATLLNEEPMYKLARLAATWFGFAKGEN
jgi:hypothetical protein